MHPHNKFDLNVIRKDPSVYMCRHLWSDPETIHKAAFQNYSKRLNKTLAKYTGVHKLNNIY